MFRYRYICPYILLFLITIIPASSQDYGNGIDSLFGYDPVLYNGRIYSHQLPPHVIGTPYLFENGFKQGYIMVRGRSYHDLAMNYDLVNQVLLLKYMNRSGATQIIEIPVAWLESVDLDSIRMEPAIRQDGKRVLCQVIESGTVRVQYFLRKDFRLDNIYGTTTFIFTEPSLVKTVKVGDREYPYRTNRDFVKAFDPSVQASINNYLKNNKIKLKKASSTRMVRLVEFCNSQIKS